MKLTIEPLVIATALVLQQGRTRSVFRVSTIERWNLSVWPQFLLYSFASLDGKSEDGDNAIHGFVFPPNGAGAVCGVVPIA